MAEVQHIGTGWAFMLCSDYVLQMGLSALQISQPAVSLEQSARDDLCCTSVNYPQHGPEFFHPFNQPTQPEKKIPVQTPASLQSDETFQRFQRVTKAMRLYRPRACDSCSISAPGISFNCFPPGTIYNSQQWGYFE